MPSPAGVGRGGRPGAAWQGAIRAATARASRPPLTASRTQGRNETKNALRGDGLKIRVQQRRVIVRQLKQLRVRRLPHPSEIHVQPQMP